MKLKLNIGVENQRKVRIRLIFKALRAKKKQSPKSKQIYSPTHTLIPTADFELIRKIYKGPELLAQLFMLEC